MATEKLETRIRREQIVQAAVSVVASDGLHRLSVARVARRVGIVPSALYRHFPSKDDILDAVLETVQERLLENTRQAREEAPDALGRLKALLRRQAALIAEHPGLPRLVFSEDVYAGHPKRRAKMYGAVRAFLERVAGIVREGQQRHEIDRGLDAGTAALLFLGLVQPPAILSYLSGGTFDAPARVEQAWPLFERALVPR